MSGVIRSAILSQENQQPCDEIRSDSTGVVSRKRKYNSIQDYSDDLGEAFTVQSTLDGPSKPATLVPKLLTSRSCLPLSYLDLNVGYDGRSGNCTISTRIPSLERSLQGSPGDHPLLIATSTNCNQLLVIERIDIGLYTQCKLAGWVTLNALERLRLLNQERPPLPKQRCIAQIDDEERDWWRPVAIGSLHGAQAKQNGKPGASGNPNVRLCMGIPRLPQRQPTSSVEQSQAAPQPPKQGSIRAPREAEEESMQPALPDPAEALAMVRTQYLQALYISRSSLAYFAKGPLSRARAAFPAAVASSDGLAVLVEYLRSSILTLPVMNKKYKDALPTIIDTLPTGIVSVDDVEYLIAGISRKTRKSKKDKLGKDGLFPREEASIAQWWLSRHEVNPESETTVSSVETRDTLLIEQRARETQLQIILILEIMALEAIIPDTSSTATLLDVAADLEDESQGMKIKKKKPLVVTTLLDILIDRLSIWQSMKIEDCKPSTAIADHSNTPQPTASETPDHLKSFCEDVVLPFYGTRLPEVTSMLCQKLGGLKAPSPIRPPLAKAASTSGVVQKPGTSGQVPPAKKPRRTLERVLTEEKTSRSRAPSLSRSATDSALPGLKREVSDTSLSTIPLNRVALQKSRRYSQREVDLKANSQANEAKLKKKALVDRELQGAIAALKKPNPRMAVKEFVEAAEQRAAGLNSRKSKNPVRNLFAQGIQVTATPKGNRQKDVFGGLPRMPSNTLTAPDEPDEIPPSSTVRIPSSTQRLAAPQINYAEPRLPRAYLQTTIQQTPTRGPAKQSRDLLGPQFHNKSTAVFLTPSKPKRYPDSGTRTLQPYNPSHSTRSNDSGGIQDTPQKPQVSILEPEKPINSTAALPDSSLQVMNSNPQRETGFQAIPSSPPIMEESSKSIFETLGWDDYVDELA